MSDAAQRPSRTELFTTSGIRFVGEAARLAEEAVATRELPLGAMRMCSDMNRSLRLTFDGGEAVPRRGS